MKTTKCKCGECGQPAVSRGLSQGCYHAAWRAVVAGKTTWRKLEAAGICEPPQHRCVSRSAINRRIDDALAK